MFIILDRVLTTKPLDIVRIGKNIGCKCGSSQLLALLAMTVIKTLEAIAHGEFYRATQTLTA